METNRTVPGDLLFGKLHKFRGLFLFSTADISNNRQVDNRECYPNNKGLKYRGFDAYYACTS